MRSGRCEMGMTLFWGVVYFLVSVVLFLSLIYAADVEAVARGFGAAVEVSP